NEAKQEAIAEEEEEDGTGEGEDPSDGQETEHYGETVEEQGGSEDYTEDGLQDEGEGVANGEAA
ncbi:MAG: cyclase, partial [Firmicutes bacterium]|nr:cyclase [Bacillota bacterium]